MFGIPTELIATYGVGGAAIVAMIFQFIKNWANTNKEKAKDDAEASLYQNLSAENTRMAGMLVTMTNQLNILLQNNTKLLSRVSALEASVKELSVWEGKAISLQAEVISKENVIMSLKVTIAEQAILIDKINRREIP